METNKLIATAFGAALGVAILFLLDEFGKESRPSRVPAGQAVVSAAQQERPPETDLFYKMVHKEQIRILKVVRHFCGNGYHRESCVVYLSRCGRACLSELSSSEILRVTKDYHLLRAENGLPPLAKGQ